MVSRKQALLDECFQSELGCKWESFRTNLPTGLIIELGVGEGGHFRLMCKTFKNRLCYGFDWFYGLPEAWDDADPKGQFSTDGIPPLSPPNGCYVVGLIQDTLKPFLRIANQKVAFVHFDMDLYSPTRFALHALERYFQDRTILLFDEIGGEEKSKNHEQKALRLWFEQNYRFSIENVGRTHAYSHAFRLIEK